jgi:hypothetical protein
MNALGLAQTYGTSLRLETADVRLSREIYGVAEVRLVHHCRENILERPEVIEGIVGTVKGEVLFQLIDTYVAGFSMTGDVPQVNRVVSRHHLRLAEGCFKTREVGIAIFYGCGFRGSSPSASFKAVAAGFSQKGDNEEEFQQRMRETFSL